MNKQETIKILMIIQAAYPNYKVQNKEVTVELWGDMLIAYSYDQVASALKAYIATDTSGFAPSIGQIIDKVQTIERPCYMNEMEAWSLVSKALRNGYYGAEEEFAKLPPLVQKAVGHPGQLRNWATTDLESIENVVQSNFMRTYRAVVREDRQMNNMPADIKHQIEQNREQQMIETESGNSEILIESQEQDFSGVPMPDSVKQRLNEIFGQKEVS